MDPAKFNLYKYDGNSLRACVLEVDLEYHKELHKFLNHYSLAANILEIKWKMLPDYQLKCSDDCNISNGNVKKIVPKFFDNEKYGLHYKSKENY